MNSTNQTIINTATEMVLKDFEGMKNRIGALAPLEEQSRIQIMSAENLLSHILYYLDIFSKGCGFDEITEALTAACNVSKQGLTEKTILLFKYKGFEMDTLMEFLNTFSASHYVDDTLDITMEKEKVMDDSLVYHLPPMAAGSCHVDILHLDPTFKSYQRITCEMNLLLESTGRQYALSLLMLLFAFYLEFIRRNIWKEISLDDLLMRYRGYRIMDKCKENAPLSPHDFLLYTWIKAAVKGIIKNSTPVVYTLASETDSNCVLLSNRDLKPYLHHFYKPDPARTEKTKRLLTQLDKKLKRDVDITLYDRDRLIEEAVFRMGAYDSMADFIENKNKKQEELLQKNRFGIAEIKKSERYQLYSQLLEAKTVIYSENPEQHQLLNDYLKCSENALQSALPFWYAAGHETQTSFLTGFHLDPENHYTLAPDDIQCLNDIKEMVQNDYLNYCSAFGIADSNIAKYSAVHKKYCCLSHEDTNLYDDIPDSISAVLDDALNDIISLGAKHFCQNHFSHKNCSDYFDGTVLKNRFHAFLKKHELDLEKEFAELENKVKPKVLKNIRRLIDLDLEQMRLLLTYYYIAAYGIQFYLIDYQKTDLYHTILNKSYLYDDLGLFKSEVDQ